MRLKDGTVICSVRHFDTFVHSSLRNLDSTKLDVAEQGFVDNKFNFLSRQEACKVAEEAGQIIYRCGGDTSEGGTLYSENLY
jgi:hypothetical protein